MPDTEKCQVAYSRVKLQMKTFEYCYTRYLKTQFCIKRYIDIWTIVQHL